MTSTDRHTFHVGDIAPDLTAALAAERSDTAGDGLPTNSSDRYIPHTLRARAGNTSAYTPPNALDAALAYASADWKIGPHLDGSKNPGDVLGTDWHAHTSSDPDTIREWFTTDTHAPFLHLGDDYIALDVDNVDTLKRIAPHIWEALIESGAPIQRTRARSDDDQRCQFLFRARPGTRYPGKLPGGTGDTRHGNAVIIVAPSEHPKAAEGGGYAWVRTGGIDHMPDDVEQWVLSKRTYNGPTSGTYTAADDATTTKFINDHTAASRPELHRSFTTRLHTQVTRGESAHNSTQPALVQAAKAARLGLVSFPNIATALRDVFITEVTGRERAARGATIRHTTEAEAEFDDMVRWAVGQAVAADQAELDATAAQIHTHWPEDTSLTDLTDLAALDLGDFMAALAAPGGLEPAVAPTPAPVTPPPSPASAPTVNAPSAPSTPAPSITTTGASLAGMSEADFWSARPILEHIYQFALARYASPWAVLGVVLVRTLSRVPYNVQIPPIVGGHASLNLFVALVGDSGTGKGAATATARDAVQLPGTEIEPETPGSGEGFARLLGHWSRGTKSDPAAQIREYSAIIDLPEVDTLAAISARGGSTYLSEFRKAYSGEVLGRRNNSDDRSIIIPSHNYRLGAIVGVQPNRSAVLLEDADGGTPQRFLWLPAQYAIPRHPDPAPPTRPDPIHPILTAYNDPVKLAIGNRVHELELPPAAIERTQEIRWRRMNGYAGKDLDAHANLTRLKVTAALAILDGRINPTDDDWNLAAAVLAKSDTTREQCAKAMQQVAHEANINRGKAAGVHAVAQNAVVEKAATARVSTNITRLLADGDWHSASDVRRRLKHSDRKHFADVLEQLRNLGQVETRNPPERPGEQIRKTPPK